MEIVKYVEGEKLFAMIGVSITDNFKSYVDGVLENFGYIEIKCISTNDKEGELYWDNLEFFLNSSMKEIKEECKQEMKEKLHYDKKLLMDIKKHLKYMKKKGYLK